VSGSTYGHRLTRRTVPAERCARCGVTEGLQRHHRDGDSRNVDLANVEVLCGRCHWWADRADQPRNRGRFVRREAVEQRRAA
jgi:hypothetical protein